MYNLSSRYAMFEALRGRPEFRSLIPIFRTFYGRSARIFLVREEGELAISEETVAGAMEAGQGDDAAAAAAAWADGGDVDAGALPAATFAAVVRVIRSRRGTHQGCVLATLGAVLPMHLVLCKVAKACPHIRIACEADDTYLSGPPQHLYCDFQYMRVLRSSNACAI